MRAWLATVLPALPAKPAPDDWPGRRAYDTAWQRALYDAGYAGLHWPVDAGGRGATPTQH
ncbi:acyl-CoA dehydrogenase, partial [Streptomyces sp. NPDC088135]